MQIPAIHYLHHTSKFCAGYDRYLEKRKKGALGVFNWYYFFFNFFWLSYHKMYKELSFTLYFYLFILVLGNKGFITIQSTALIISSFYFLSCFYTYYFYEIAFSNKLRLNDPNPLKKIKPFNFLVSIGIFLTLMTVNISFYSVFLAKLL